MWLYISNVIWGSTGTDEINISSSPVGEENQHYIHLGNMSAWWDGYWVIPKTNITIPPEEERHYNFTLNEDGTITANFSYGLSTWPRKNLIIYRMTSFDVTIFDGPTENNPRLKYCLERTAQAQTPTRPTQLQPGR